MQGLVLLKPVHLKKCSSFKSPNFPILKWALSFISCLQNKTLFLHLMFSGTFTNLRTETVAVTDAKPETAPSQLFLISVYYILPELYLKV